MSRRLYYKCHTIYDDPYDDCATRQNMVWVRTPENATNNAQPENGQNPDGHPTQNPLRVGSGSMEQTSHRDLVSSGLAARG